MADQQDGRKQGGLGWWGIIAIVVVALVACGLLYLMVI